MKSLTKTSAFVFGILATVLIGQTVSAATVSGPKFSDNAITDTAVVAASTSEQSVDPISRDYHDVLAAYDADKSDEYKFSGCGGVI